MKKHSEKFINEIFKLFVSGKKEEAEKLLIRTINEAVDYSVSEIDLNKVLSYSLSKINSELSDEIEKLAKDVFQKVKVTKDWNEIATLYLKSKGIEPAKIEKVISTLDSLYNI